jgi:hypothetical protein
MVETTTKERCDCPTDDIEEKYSEQTKAETL